MLAYIRFSTLCSDRIVSDLYKYIFRYYIVENKRHKYYLDARNNSLDEAEINMM